MAGFLLALALAATGVALGWFAIVAVEWLDRHIGPWWSTAVVAVVIAASVAGLVVFG